MVTHTHHRKNPAAGLLIVAPTGRVLLGFRAPWTNGGNTWAIPGGVIDIGETAWHAAIRECNEELSLGITEADLCLVDEHTVNGPRRDYTTHTVFVGEEFRFKVDETETTDACWIHPQEALNRLTLHWGVVAALHTLV